MSMFNWLTDQANKNLGEIFDPKTEEETPFIQDRGRSRGVGFGRGGQRPQGQGQTQKGQGQGQGQGQGGAGRGRGSRDSGQAQGQGQGGRVTPRGPGGAGRGRGGQSGKDPGNSGNRSSGGRGGGERNSSGDRRTNYDPSRSRNQGGKKKPSARSDPAPPTQEPQSALSSVVDFFSRAVNSNLNSIYGEAKKQEKVEDSPKRIRRDSPSYHRKRREYRTPSYVGEGDDGSAVSTPRSTPRGARLYDPYWSPEEIQSGLEKEIIHEGVLHFNPKNRKEAFVKIAGFSVDVLIVGLDQNRAFEGDTVAIMLYPYHKWPRYRPPSIAPDDDNYDDEIDSESSEVSSMSEGSNRHRYSKDFLLSKAPAQKNPELQKKLVELISPRGAPSAETTPRASQPARTNPNPDATAVPNATAQTPTSTATPNTNPNPTPAKSSSEKYAEMVSKTPSLSLNGALPKIVESPRSGGPNSPTPHLDALPDGAISPGKQIVAPGKEARQDKFKRPLGYIVGVTRALHMERVFTGLMRGNREGNKALRKNLSSGNLLASGANTPRLNTPRSGNTPRNETPRNEKTPRREKRDKLNSKSDAEDSASDSEYKDKKHDDGAGSASDSESDNTEFTSAKKGLPSSTPQKLRLSSSSSSLAPPLSPTSLNRSGGLSKSGRERPYLDGLSASTRARYVADLSEKPEPVDRTALFIPTDTRDPRFIVSIDELPSDWISNFAAYADTIFEVKVDYWHEKISFPYGKDVRIAPNQPNKSLSQSQTLSPRLTQSPRQAQSPRQTQSQLQPPTESLI